MATQLGINNPNSKYNRSLRESYLPALPPTRDGKINNLEQLIRALTNLRAFKYGTNDLYGARLHAIRLGTVRRELRQLKAGKS